jgi:magnesium transporter
VISIFHFDEKTGLERGGSVEQVALYRGREGGVLWVDFESPSDAETALLDEVFAFHPLAIEDCREASDYPKLDDFEKYLFLVMLAPDLLSAEQEDPVMLGLNMFLSRTYVVTYHERPLRSISQLRVRLESEPQEVMGKGSGFLAHAILDALVDQHYAAVESLDDAVERYQDQILERPRKEILDKILTIRSHVIQLRRILSDERNIMARFSHPVGSTLSSGRGGGVSGLIGEEVQRYFSDLYEHLDELMDSLDVARDSLAGARDLYLSVSAHRTNETMRALAIIATIMMPLMFLTGVYGMNVTLPLGKSPSAFVILAAVMVLVALGFFGFFRWKKWI